MTLYAQTDALKILIESLIPLSRDSLHIHTGLLIFWGTALCARQSIASLWPWLATFLVAVLCEIIDLSRYYPVIGTDPLKASMIDFFNTLCWPSVLALSPYCKCFAAVFPPLSSSKPHAATQSSIPLNTGSS